ncbi:hypothetical protein RUND412_000517 [Rhizina undulata]
MKFTAALGLSALTAMRCVLAQAPPTLSEILSTNEDISQLALLLTQNPEVEQALSLAGSFTILAPTNDALEKWKTLAESTNSLDSSMTAALLSYHVLNGSYNSTELFDGGSQYIPTYLADDETFANLEGDPQIIKTTTEDDKNIIISGLYNNASVVTADIVFDHGFIHIIDNVLALPVNVTATAESLELTSFLSALESTNLTEALNALASSTVFVPNNDAFSSAALSNGSNVEQILKYHVISGIVGYAGTLENGTQFETLAGPNITISIIDNTVYVNNVKVVVADVITAGGVIHIIDGVLDPNSTTTNDANLTATSSSNTTATGVAENGVSSINGNTMAAFVASAFVAIFAFV